MLTTLLACTCEASEDGDGPYVRWVAAAMHLCVYADNARDVAALVALAVHVVAWSDQRTQRRQSRREAGKEGNEGNEGNSVSKAQPSTHRWSAV